jgi:hypothetical protein
LKTPRSETLMKIEDSKEMAEEAEEEEEAITRGRKLS